MSGWERCPICLRWHDANLAACPECFTAVDDAKRDRRPEPEPIVVRWRPAPTENQPS